MGLVGCRGIKGQGIGNGPCVVSFRGLADDRFSTMYVTNFLD